MSARVRVALAALVLGTSGARAQDISDAGFVFWGAQLERAEYRYGDGEDDGILAAEGDAFVGTDEIKLRYAFEGEYGLDARVMEVNEHQLALQIPISTFFDAKAGVRLDAPEGPDRWYGVVGVHGLAPQWFEIDADAFVSETGDVSARFEAEYEGLITQRIILTPAIEIDVGLTDDKQIGAGSGLRSVEVGARLSYDLLERNVAPYIGVHYERLFGETEDLARDEGEDDDGFFVVAGVRLMF